MIKRMINLLMGCPRDPHELMILLDIKSEKMLEKYLDDIQRICKRKGWKLVVIPAQCKKCGFILRKNTKIPSKCPKCKSYRISKPKFCIKQ